MKDQVIDDDVDEEIKLEAANDTRFNIVIKCKNKHLILRRNYFDKKFTSKKIILRKDLLKKHIKSTLKKVN